jgi:hypothetical protein
MFDRQQPVHRMLTGQSTKRSLAVTLAILLAGSLSVTALSPSASCLLSKSSSRLAAVTTSTSSTGTRSTTVCRAARTTRTDRIIDEQVELSNGISMQLMALFPTKSDDTAIDKPALLFLHGSFHGAWCWAEHFLPYFCEMGYPAIALNWRHVRRRQREESEAIGTCRRSPMSLDWCSSRVYFYSYPNTHQ